WLILFAIPSYLSIADLGFAQSAGNDMTAKVSRGDYAGALAVFQGVCTLVILLAIAGLALSAWIIQYLPLENWASFSFIGHEELRWILWLLGAQVFISLIDGINHAGFRTVGEYPLHIGLRSTTRLVQFGGLWLVASIGAGPVAGAAAFFGVRLICT